MATRNRGKSKPKLQDLSHIPLTFEERRVLVDSIRGNVPPIAAAIMGAVLVEHELERSLRRRFPRNDDETWSGLLTDSGPLNSFYAKIVAGYAFRLYDKETRENLHIVRKIRNVFAHSKKIINFDHELIISELKKTMVPTSGPMKKFYSHIRTIDGNAHVCYISLCEALTGDIVDKFNSAMRSKRYRLQKTLDRKKRQSAELRTTLAKLQLWGAAAGLMPAPTIGQGSNPRLPRGHHSGGPTNGVPKGSLPGSPGSGAKNGDKTDK